jgi:hypothetical protein
MTKADLLQAIEFMVSMCKPEQDGKRHDLMLIHRSLRDPEWRPAASGDRALLEQLRTTLIVKAILESKAATVEALLPHVPMELRPDEIEKAATWLVALPPEANALAPALLQ